MTYAAIQQNQQPLNNPLGSDPYFPTGTDEGEYKLWEASRAQIGLGEPLEYADDLSDFQREIQPD